MRYYIDFESYFDSKFNLKNLATAEYVRDDRFQILGLGVAKDDEPVRWIENHDDIEAMAREILHNADEIVAHNLHFDAMVLNHILGYRINLTEETIKFSCTLSACNNILPPGIPRNLDSACKTLGIEGKVKGTLNTIKGIRKKDLTEEQQKNLAEYCTNDVEIMRKLYKTIYHLLPEEERHLIHMTIRMNACPKLKLDKNVMKGVILQEREEREALLERVGLTRTQLASDQQFASHLSKLLNEDTEWVKRRKGKPIVPTKLNAKGNEIPALAKNDPEFQEILAYAQTENQDLLALLEARKLARSTVTATRGERMIAIADMWPHTLPVPYNYCGAHTKRWSGADKLNMQAIPSLRVNNMRKAIVAPDEMVIHVVDMKQIELRFNLWFCGEANLLNYIARGGDPYAVMGAKRFNVPFNDVTKHMRAVGKALILGCGYRMGASKFQRFMASGPFGMPPMQMTLEEAALAVSAYRTSHPCIAQMWETLDNALIQMTQPGLDENPWQIGPITITYQGINLPNGNRIDYSGLRALEEGGFAYGLGPQIRFIHGGIVLENTIQALARIPVATAAVETEKQLPHVQCVAWTHDENIFIGPEKTAKEDHAIIQETHRRRPPWALDLPIDVEGGYAKEYSH